MRIDELFNVTTGDVIDAGAKAWSVAQTPLFDIPGLGAYTIGDAVIDGALLAGDLATLGAITPAIAARLSTRVATKVGEKELANFAARKGVQTAEKDVAWDAASAAERNAIKQKEIGAADRNLAGKEVRREVVKGVAKSLMPDFSASAPDTMQKPMAKKRKGVGELHPVKIGGKSYNLPIVQVLPSNGYVVDAGNIPGQKPGTKLNAPEEA